MDNLEHLKNAYPEYFHNGETYAESWLTSLLKMEKKGLLGQLTGIKALPLPQEKDLIAEFVEKKAIPVSQRQCMQDLNERNVSDAEGHTHAFTTAFRSKLTMLLENRSINECGMMTNQTDNIKYKNIDDALRAAEGVFGSDALKAFDIVSVAAETFPGDAAKSSTLIQFCRRAAKKLIEIFRQRYPEETGISIQVLTAQLRNPRNPANISLLKLMDKKVDEWKAACNGRIGKVSVSSVCCGLYLPQYFLDLLVRLGAPDEDMQDRLYHTAMVTGNFESAYDTPEVTNYTNALEAFVDSYLDKNKDIGRSVRMLLCSYVSAELEKRTLKPEHFSVHAD
jgi:hypothetical protein